MKKITLLTFLLSAFLGFSQDLITNGDFETGELTPFTSGSGAAVVSGDPYEGGSRLNLGNDFANLRQKFTAVAGTQYKASFYYKLSNTGVDPEDAPYFSIRLDDGSNNGEVIDEYSLQLDETTTTYTKYELTFTAPQAALMLFVFSPERNASGAKTNNAVRIDNISIVEEAIASVEDFTQFNFKSYPNPASNNITMSATKNIEKVALFNLLGQKVLSAQPKSNKATINISMLNNGIYIIKTSIEGIKGSYKFLKQ
jgi:hypothetical protein